MEDRGGMEGGTEAANNPRAISPFHPLVFQWILPPRIIVNILGEGRESSLYQRGGIETEDRFFFLFLFFIFASLPSLILYPLSFARWRDIISFEETILSFCIILMLISFRAKSKFHFFLFFSKKEIDVQRDIQESRSL